MRKYTKEDIAAMKVERTDLEKFRDLAKQIWKNSKGEAKMGPSGRKNPIGRSLTCHPQIP